MRLCESEWVKRLWVWRECERGWAEIKCAFFSLISSKLHLQKWLENNTKFRVKFLTDFVGIKIKSAHVRETVVVICIYIENLMCECNSQLEYQPLQVLEWINFLKLCKLPQRNIMSKLNRPHLIFSHCNRFYKPDLEKRIAEKKAAEERIVVVRRLAAWGGGKVARLR